MTSIWAATFLFKCMMDLFRDISSGGHQLSDPYPQGRFSCVHVHEFPAPISNIRAVLELDKIPAPNWQMTFEDLSYDVEALWYAALFFVDPVFGLPMMNVVVRRYVSGESGPTFLAERGSLRWEHYTAANVSTS